jgi:signal peptidase I
MYNKEEIDNSLEFCRDIKVFYEPTKEDNINYFLNNEQYKTIYSPDFVQKEPVSLFYILRKEFMGFLLCIVIAVILSNGFITYVAQQTKVDGDSMENNIHDKDYLIIDKISYRFHKPDRFDIIVFPFDEEDFYIKRIIGLPGETIFIKEGVIFINDKPLEENYGNAEIIDSGNLSKKVQIGEHEYVVLGDNRNNSLDSRFTTVGFIKEKDIVGKAWVRIYPFDSFGSITTNK